MVNRPSPLVSYAQNGEDIVLSRALEPWNYKGTWVDVGAGHPTYDSVTRLFSDFGWTGVNIEPLSDCFRLLCDARPNDTNVNCAITNNPGTFDLYVAPPENHGSSTLIADLAVGTGATSWPIERVNGRALREILAEHGITRVDFLKIDVEGSELSVLQSIDFVNFRAKCIVVESTIPNSTILSHANWESILIDAGYLFALFDGLNRFYFHQSFPEIGQFLSYPACVLDNYVRNLDEEEKTSLRTEVSNALKQIDALETALMNAEIYANSLEVSLTQAIEYAQSLEIKLSHQDGTSQD